MLDRLWRNTTERRTFVTGGIGPSASNEGFTVDYDLPNRTAYQETCASVAMALWGHRMALLHADAQYMDWVERALYNGVLAGVSLDGKGFFYVNPLASGGTHHRSDWFGCACCPPNVLRTIASVGGYGYAVSGDNAYVNLFLQGTAMLDLASGKVPLKVETDYPWDGKVTLRPSPTKDAAFALHVRIPGWSRDAKITLNGKPMDAPLAKGYAVIERTWRKGDVVVLDLPMPVEQIMAHPGVKADVGRAALQRGPLVYCLEQIDQSAPLSKMVLPAGTVFSTPWSPSLLGGIVTLEGEAQLLPEREWDRVLYQPVGPARTAKVRAVPYAVWDNRKAGPMEVWMPTVEPPGRFGGPEVHAQVALSYTSGNAQPWAVNDGLAVAKSGEQPDALCHFWPHKGSVEWIQYTWTKPITIRGVEVFWFDDTGRGECRLPTSWKLQRLDGDQWLDVKAEFPVPLDQWSKVAFAPFSTTKLRLSMQMQTGWSAGVHEWKVLGDQ